MRKKIDHKRLGESHDTFVAIVVTVTIVGFCNNPVVTAS